MRKESCDLLKILQKDIDELDAKIKKENYEIQSKFVNLSFHFETPRSAEIKKKLSDLQFIMVIFEKFGYLKSI